jgi:diguanylate cyclase
MIKYLNSRIIQGQMDEEKKKVEQIILSVADVVEERNYLRQEVHELKGSLQEAVEEKRRISQEKEEEIQRLRKEKADAIRMLRHEARIARTDELTGAYNRRGADRELRRLSADYAVAIVDIDHFKKVNDTYGHDAGDSVLCGLVGIIAESVRKNDLIARYGGEEFLVIMPDCSLETAREKAEYLRSTVKQKVWDELGGEGITISIGVAYGNPMQEKKEVIKDADIRLYEAKKTRDSVC